MPNLVRIAVDGEDDLLNAGMYDAGAVVRLQSSATKTGVYASVGTAALVSGTGAYTIYHAAGTSTTWYRSRYENAAATITSDWSDPFQVGGEEGGYLCSLYDVKERLGIADSTTTYDEPLLELIRSVTTEIEEVTGRDFTGDRDDQVYTFDIGEMTTLLEVERGIQSVTTLEVASATGAAYTAVTSYKLRPANREWLGEPYYRIELYDGNWFYRGYDTVRVTGRLGWAEVPPQVSRIAAGAVVAKHLTKGSDGARAVIGENGQATILRDISPDDQRVLMGLAVPLVR